MIERVVTTSASAEAFSDAPEWTMLAGEAAVVSDASRERRREFATARHCAHQALLAIGEPVAAIGRDEVGAPRWPAGVVGSITHCAGYRAAAVGRSGELAGIGIDAERHDALPADALELVAAYRERVHLRALNDADPNVHWDRVLFCVKEAVYKAWFPLARRWLEFTDVSARLRRDGTFSARLRVKAPFAAGLDPRSFGGRWIVSRGLILAATSVSR
jgi:4'-phosphopantetheinyl transferase EntD